MYGSLWRKGRAEGWATSMRRTSLTRHGRLPPRATGRRRSLLSSQPRWRAEGWASSMSRTSPTRHGRSPPRATRRRRSLLPSQLRWCAGVRATSMRRTSPTRHGRSPPRATRRRRSLLPSQLRWLAGGWATSVRSTSPTRHGLLLSLMLLLRTSCLALRALRRGVPNSRCRCHFRISRRCISGRSGDRSVARCGRGCPVRYSWPAARLSPLKKGCLRSCNPMWCEKSARAVSKWRKSTVAMRPDIALTRSLL